MTNSGRSFGKTWLMNIASMVALAACSDGNAPKTRGDAVKLEVYMSTPRSLSMAARPAGEPGTE
jgi:hypothetical protein